MFYATRSKIFIIFTAVLLAVCLILPLFAPVYASAYTPSRKILQIGLNFGTDALPSANLANPGGFEFGFYDDNFQFYPVLTTPETAISVMVDRNMQWNPPASAGGTGAFSGQYDLVGSSGQGTPSGPLPFIGFAHTQLHTGFPDIETALSVIAGGGFIRYNAGSPVPYMPLTGSYPSSAAAPAPVDSGGSKTVTVAVLGTDRIIFEFDPGLTSYCFGIRPLNPAIASTYRGYSFYGGFRYDRREATKLTIANIIDLETYVKGVIPYEMSGSWPVEALKAQAVCARTFALASINGKHSSHRIDLCNTACCQVYRGVGSANVATNSAVDATAGQVVTYGGNLISTYYSSSHGGGSENNENVWAGNPLPYLRGVLDDFEEAANISNYNWTYTISQDTITGRVRNAGHSGASTIVAVRVSQYSPTGNAIAATAVDSNGREYTFTRRAGIQSLFGGDIRSIRFNIGDVKWAPGSAFFVNSPAQPVVSDDLSVITSTGTFPVPGSGMVAIDGSGNLVTVTATGGSNVSAGTNTGPVNGNFILTGRGWGHSVGMSQWGAYSQALYFGRSYVQIITHYYTGVEITQT